MMKYLFSTCGASLFGGFQIPWRAAVTPNAILDRTLEFDILFYPNPAMSIREIFILMPPQTTINEIKVSGIDGRAIASNYDGKMNSLKILTMIPGNYLCTVQTSNGIKTKRITIR